MMSAAGTIAFVVGWVWRMSWAHATASDRNQAIRARDGSVEISYGILPGSSSEQPCDSSGDKNEDRIS